MGIAVNHADAEEEEEKAERAVFVSSSGRLDQQINNKMISHANNSTVAMMSLERLACGPFGAGRLC
jgi:hypothetical protein